MDTVTRSLAYPCLLCFSSGHWRCSLCGGPGYILTDLGGLLLNVVLGVSRA
jgi:hypothetical protein